MEEALLLGDFLHQAKPLRRLPVTSAKLVKVHSMVIHVITFMAVIHSIHKRGLTIVHRHQRESLFLWDLAGEDQRHFREVLRSCGKQVRLVDGPEPQRAPVVHGEFQTSVFAGVLGLFRMVGNVKHLIFLANGEVVAAEVFAFDAERPLPMLLLVFQSFRSFLGGIRIETVDDQIVLGRLLQLPTCLDLAAPQFVDGLRQRPHQADLRCGIWLLGESLLPRLDGFQILGFNAFDSPVVILAHVRISSQELVDALDG